jgi:PAS domain S-box-containing protein
MIESTERKLAESELKTQKEFSEELITSLNEGLSVIDLNGKLIKVNGALCKMTGFSEEELLGRGAPFPYWPPEEKDNIIKAFNDPLNNLGVNSKRMFMRKNGERFPVSLTSSSIKNHDGEIIAYFSTIIDITDSLKAENFLKEVAIKSTERKKVLMKLSGLVGTDYHNSLEQITLLSATILNVERAGVWRFNETRDAIICENLYDAKTGKFESGVVLKNNDNPSYFVALADNKTISVEDAVNNDITKGFANDYLIPVGITSMLDVFIQGANEIYGVICFEHVGPKRQWSADDEEFATSIANVVSLMVESTERKMAEANLISSNEALLVANTELEKLRSQLVDENVYLRNEIDLVFNYEEMVYGSEVFSAVLTEVEKVATTNATVLLLGESGTGKELLARAIQNIGNRKQKPLIKVNCAAIPRELIESELFGHVKGSFTGAINDKVGKFELADGGTLFLDEIGELPLDMQPKLLRFLQEGEIEKVGDTRTLKVDVRIIAATNKDLKKEVEKKLFREDLYFRLNVFPIMVPPLRERTEDIPLLLEHFADKFSKAYGKEVTYITDGAMLAMKRYKWPGNIRELENVIERAVILSNNNFLVLPDFDTKLQAKERLIAASDLTLDDVQREHIIKTLDKCNWKIDGANGASSILNIKPSTLRDRMKKLGVVKPA